MKPTKGLLCLWLSTSFFFISPATLAQAIDAEIDTDINFYFGNSPQTEAECYLRVGQNEPYIAFNGDCRIYRNNELAAINHAQNAPIPYPRSEDFQVDFFAVEWNSPPHTGSVYCAKFGWDDGSGSLWVILGHATDTSQNFYFPESSTCNTPTSPFQAFFDPWCSGVPQCAFSLSEANSPPYESWRRTGYSNCVGNNPL